MNLEKLNKAYLGGSMSSSPEGATIKLHYSTADAAEAAFVELTDAIDEAKPLPSGGKASPEEPSEVARNLADRKTLAARMELFAELLAEAATVIENIPHEVFTTLQARFPLADELHGASVIARDEAKALLPTANSR